MGKVECKEFTHPRCLQWKNKTQSCVVLDCWKYDSIGGCERAGKPWVPAIILQSIPLTGMFGSGFGNIGRWDIFTIYILGFFCPILLVCLIGCCCLCCKTNEEGQPLLQQDSAGGSILLSGCGCLWGIQMLFLWIWGIVQIAGKQVDAPWHAHNGTNIMCPMV